MRKLLASGGVDSLLALHGVMCAFLVSISVGMEEALQPEAFRRADFYGAIAKEQGFREWIFEVLNATDYSWNVTVAPGRRVDIQYELLHGVQSRFPKKRNLNSYVSDAVLSLIFDWLYPDFPMKMMDTWFIANPNAYRTSAFALGWAAFSTNMFYVGLLGNVLIYLSFLTCGATNAEQEPSGEGQRVPFEKWCRFGFPAIALNYFLLLVGIVQMFVANTYKSAYASPFPDAAFALYGGPYLGTLSFFTLLFGASSVYAWFQATGHQPPSIRECIRTCTLRVTGKEPTLKSFMVQRT